MAEKLSTAKLKDLISKWLSKPEIRENLSHHSDAHTHEDIDYTAELFGGKKGCTQPELEEHIWKLWCDGGRWKRREKRALKDEWEDKLSTTEYLGEWKPGLPGNQQERRQVPYFDVDMVGEANMELVAKLHADPKQAAKCIFREFEPDNQLADNYRLEVITTPDDSEVVGWTVIVD